MKEEVINELLEQLKNNLKNVESAQQQVENTVKSYNALEGEVAKFVTELSFITQNTRTIIQQLEEVKRNFLANVSSELFNKISQGVTDISNVVNTSSTEIKQLTNSAKSSIVKAVDSSEQKVSDKVQETGDSVKSDIINSIDSIKNVLYIVMGISAVTLIISVVRTFLM